MEKLEEIFHVVFNNFTRVSRFKIFFQRKIIVCIYNFNIIFYFMNQI